MKKSIVHKSYIWKVVVWGQEGNTVGDFSFSKRGGAIHTILQSPKAVSLINADGLRRELNNYCYYCFRHEIISRRRSVIFLHLQPIQTMQ